MSQDKSLNDICGMCCGILKPKFRALTTMLGEDFNPPEGVVAVSVPVGVRKALGGFVVDNQIPVRVLVKPADDIQERGFAATGMTKDGDEFILPEFEVHALEGVNKRIADLIVFFDLAEFEHLSVLPENSMLTSRMICCRIPKLDICPRSSAG